MTKSNGIKFAVLAAAVMVSAAAATPASAETQYPWCARYNESTVGATNCGFTSLQQCREATFGVGGGCYRNPAYQPPERPRRR